MVPQPEDLSGHWDVYHIKFDETPIRTTKILIVKSVDSVWFVEAGDTISTGIIVADTTRCSGLCFLRISRIFIDDSSHLHSELPLAEYYRHLDFVRRGHWKSGG